MGRKALDLMNQKFTNLTVVGRASRSKAGLLRWKCQCICGNVIVVPTGALRSGNSKSCGCLRIPEFKKTEHPLYKKWSEMKKRCNSNGEYGSKGIFMCDYWIQSFENFLSDMEATWEPGLTIERIDNEKGYEKSNCRWVTSDDQLRNRTCDRDVIVTFPDGHSEIVVGGQISNFCKDQGFDIRKMNDVLKGRRKHYRNFTAVYAKHQTPGWLRPFA